MLDAAAAAAAGTAAVEALVEGADVIDLTDTPPPALRVVRDDEAASYGLGCPCGCGESELLARARAGDDVALSAMISRYRALARTKARSYFVLGADAEDVVQEATIGLYAAIRDYDPSRGVSFRAFAEVCVVRSVLSAVKRGSRRKHDPLNRGVPLETPAGGGGGGDDESGRTLVDLVAEPSAADPLAELIGREQLVALRRHLDEVLSDLEAQVLRHHVEGKTYDQIAALLQRHVKSVDNALQRIRRKVQEHLDQRTAAESA